MLQKARFQVFLTEVSYKKETKKVAADRNKFDEIPKTLYKSPRLLEPYKSKIERIEVSRLEIISSLLTSTVHPKSRGIKFSIMVSKKDEESPLVH
ncbi:hypothetical protein CEXT_195881 [Caerostris extrusa]|uniref:Uncharacterized protein n=1 Tax=Caerostris extrusa TaxID=172846 RepID=A0AAV4XD15_CAEEX|nr:hypothetical protein CEXT_195881 [Caerostris extrusa]